MTPEQTCYTVAKAGAGVRLDTRSSASCVRPRCRARATCVLDPGHCEPLDGKQGSSTAPGCGARLRDARGSPADHITGPKKSFCCVTTQRRNLGILNGLGRGFDSLTARFFGLGMLGFGLGGLSMLGLPSCRLPLADLPQALRFPAVALVPAPRQVLPATSFAQAGPRAWSTPSGGTAAFPRTLTSAHGRCSLPRESSGRMLSNPPRARSKRQRDNRLPVYRSPANKTENKTISEARFRRRRQNQHTSSGAHHTIENSAVLLIGPRQNTDLRDAAHEEGFVHVDSPGTEGV